MTSYWLDGNTASVYDAAMKIKTTIQSACRKRGINSAYQLQKVAGLYPSAAARLFKDDLAKVDLDSLSRLCEKLSKLPEKRPKKIQVSELFILVEDVDQDVAEDEGHKI